MAEYKLAVIAGDGVGPEVIAEGKKVLDALSKSNPNLKFTYDDLPWGSAYYRENGKMMPDDGLEMLKSNQAIFFGAVGDPDIPDHITLQGLLLPMRRAFDQAISIRPCYLHPGVDSPIVGKKAGDIDMVIYRERIIRAAFEGCILRNKQNKVTSVTKSNAQAFSMVFWDEVFAEVASDYPQIQTESLLVDRAAMDLARWPESFDVIVASNLFADILSDIAAVVTGSMGLAASANINPEREYPSMRPHDHTQML